MKVLEISIERSFTADRKPGGSVLVETDSGVQVRIVLTTPLAQEFLDTLLPCAQETFASAAGPAKTQAKPALLGDAS